MAGMFKEGGLSSTIGDQISPALRDRLKASVGLPLTYTIGEQLSPEQQEAFKNIASTIWSYGDSEEATAEIPSSTSIHRRRIRRKVNAIFNSSPGEIIGDDSSRALNAGDSRLEVIKKDGTLSRVFIRDLYDGKFYYGRTLSIEFDSGAQNPQVTLSRQYGYFESALTVMFGPLDDTGNATLPDETEITMWKGMDVYSSIYSRTEKTVDWQSGIALFVDEDKVAKKITVRDDYGDKGLEYPTEINIYRELNRFLKKD